MALTRPRAYQIYDIDYKQATRVITVANITLSGGAPSQVDGVTLSLNDRVLVTGQSTAAQNGIYYVTTVGSGANGTWARSNDTNQTGELLAGTIVMVTEGLVYADTQWKLVTDDPIVIGVSELIFEQNSAFAFGNVYANGTAVLASSVGDVLTLSAGNNISITGNNTSKTVTIGVTGISLNSISNGTSNVNVVSSGGNVTVGIAGTSNVAVFSSTGANVTGTLGVSGNISAIGQITAGNFVGNGIPTTTVSASAPSSPEQGDIWIDTDTGIQYIYFNDGTGNQWAEMEAQTAYSYSSAGTPSGSNTEVQFNNSGAFGSDSRFTFDSSSNAILTVSGNVNAGNLISNAAVFSPAMINNGSYNTQIELGAVSGIIAITTDGNSTQFLPSGQINLGGASQVVGGTFGGSGITLGLNQTDIFQNRDGNVTVQVGTGGTTTSTWTFTNSGNLIAPGNISTAGQVTATGNITAGNVTTTGAVYSNFNTNTANTASFNATGGNTKGGTGYLDFLVAQNTSGGATNPYKWLRVNSTGGLEIINSAYTATLLTLTDAGAFSVASTVSGTGFNVNNKQAVNGPAFSASANASTTIPTDVLTKVNFQAEEYDTNSNFASSRFTPTVEGYYQLNSTVRISGSSGTGEMMIVLYKNGAEYHRGWNSQGVQIGSGWWSMSVSSTAYANGTGDYFEIYVQQGSAANRDTTSGPTITWFNGCMLRGA